jgi:hypoxanthine-DNA glycosylase
VAALVVIRTAARGLPPLLPRRARVLVLGSFPGVASLAARQYYAHPRNHFWPVIGALLDEPLASLPYRARLERLSARGIALWDTIVACEREGSSDGSIRRAERAEVSRVRRASPGIEVVAFNGNTAARALPRWRDAGYATLALPSTSPAYTRPFADKLAAWRALEPWIGGLPVGGGKAESALPGRGQGPVPTVDTTSLAKGHPWNSD